MLVKKFILAGLVALAVSAQAAMAGDTASFVNLGFSADGKTYMFGQYGIQSNGLRPWAEIYLVDVAKNDFLPGGKLSFVQESGSNEWQDGSGALYHLIAENGALFSKSRLDFLTRGKPLFISLEGAQPADTIEFRDFANGIGYKASLKMTKEGANSSFYIDVQKTDASGSENSLKAGSPNIKRPVTSYTMRQVMAAPENKALIFVIEMQKQGTSGSDIRYMVETLPLK
ncbi:MAG: DUF2259 domain-containing protein [Spirochaetaceae bacterium]|jgi:predicted secreted protein|nr:DUF2259 domain-containing protein [Spirochaetaceae bacterium]